MRASVLLVGCLFWASCFALLNTPATAQLSCSSDADCPPGAACSAEVGLCAIPESPCVEVTASGAGFLADGNVCLGEDGAEALCIRGRCATSTCGDGFVDETSETCDNGLQNSDVTADACRLNCQPASCGDGVVDFGEVCDGDTLPFGRCTEHCQVMCEDGRGDCNGDTRDGCECETALLAGSVEVPVGFAGDRDGLFFASHNEIRRFAPGEITTTTIAEIPSLPNFIMVDANRVYWTDNVFGVSASDRPLGGSVIQIDSAPANYAAQDDTYVYWTTTAGTIKRQGKDLAGDPVVLVDYAPAQPYFITVSDESVFWADLESGVIYRIPKDGAAQPTVVQDGQVGPRGIAFLDDALYWADDTERILRKDLTTGALTVFAEAQPSPFHVIAEGGSLYWTARNHFEHTGWVARRSPGDVGVTIVGAGQDHPFWVALIDGAPVWTTFDGLTTHRPSALFPLADPAAPDRPMDAGLPDGDEAGGLSNPLPVQLPFAATIEMSPAGDADCFSFAIEAERLITVFTEAEGGGDCDFERDTAVYLYAGGETDADAYLETDDDGGLERCSLLETTQPAGTYVACVEHFSRRVPFEVLPVDLKILTSVQP